MPSQSSVSFLQRQYLRRNRPRIVDALFAEFPLPAVVKPARLPRILSPVCWIEIHGLGLAVLAEQADFHPGDRVKTLSGSCAGKFVRVLPDGRVVWRADSGAELTGLPESLIREKKPTLILP